MGIKKLDSIICCPVGKTFTLDIRRPQSNPLWLYSGGTVEVMNRFKGLDLIDMMPEELWTEVSDIVQEAVIKTIPKKRNEKRQNGCLKKPYKQLRKEEKQKAKEKRKDITI